MFRFFSIFVLKLESIKCILTIDHTIIRSSSVNSQKIEMTAVKILKKSGYIVRTGNSFKNEAL